MGRYQKKSPIAVHGRRMTSNPVPEHENHAPKTPSNSNKSSTMFGKIKSVFKTANGMQEIESATDSGDDVSRIELVFSN
jgi:hypothetical protein